MITMILTFVTAYDLYKINVQYKGVLYQKWAAIRTILRLPDEEQKGSRD